MPLTIKVGGAGNSYAHQVINEVRGNPIGNDASNVVEQPALGAVENEHPAQGLLMRTLQQIRKEAGSLHSAYLSDIVMAKNVNLNLDHSDEVDGGISMHTMDSDWVEIDFASDLGRPSGGSKDDASAVRAQQTMAALEQVSVDDVRESYAEFLNSLPADMDENQKKAELMKLITETGVVGIQGTITNAIKAQVKLAETLYSACLQQIEPDRALLQVANRCHRCADALLGLVIKVATAPNNAVSLPGASVVEALDQEMLPKDVGLRRETTEKVVRIIDEQLIGLNQLYDSLLAGYENVSSKQFRQLEDGLLKAKNLLVKAQGGVVLSGGKNLGNVEFQNLDKDVLSQLEARIGEMSKRIEALKIEALNDVVWEIRDNFPLDILNSPLFDERYATRFIDKYSETLKPANRQKIKGQIEDYRTALGKLKMAVDDAVKTGRTGKVFEIIQYIGRIDPNVIFDYVENIKIDPAMRQAEGLPEITSNHRSWLLDRMKGLIRMTEDDGRRGGIVLNRLADMVKNVKGKKIPAISGALLTKVMDGSYGLSTAALSVAWGEDATLLRPGIDDRFLISSKTLGSGACNTVKLCSYRKLDGSTQHRVFKPELPARVSLDEQNDMDEMFRRYYPTQKVSMINVSVCRMARLLGLGNSVVDAHTGVHGGQFGLMMELAEGVSGESLTKAFRSGDLNKRVGHKTIGELQTILNEQGEDAKKLIGNLRRAITDLDWLDRIVGQTDRHFGNYMISIGDDLSVSLKGIDNDQCFSPDDEKSTGNRTYPPVISRSTYTKLEQLFNSINGLSSNPAAVRHWLRKSDKLGMTGLTDAQLDKVAERIKAAWVAANNNCAIFDNDEDWYNLQTMKEQVNMVRSHSQHLDYFTRDVVNGDIFSRASLSDGIFTDWWGNSNSMDNKYRKQFICMRNVVNAENFENRFQSLQNGEPPISLTEFKSYFSALARTPSTASRAVSPWPEDNNEDRIFLELIKSCRNEKKKILQKLQEDNIVLKNDELENCMQLYFSESFFGDVETFRNVFKVIYGHQAFARLEIQNLLKFGGDLNWALFISECSVKTRNISKSLIAEALMSELANPSFKPAELDVGRLRRLVVNKFKVTPRQVFGREVQLNNEDFAIFHKACAITGANEEYYANVKAKYDELKGKDNGE